MGNNERPYYDIIKIIDNAMTWLKILEEAKDVEDPKHRKYKEIRKELLDCGPGEQIQLLDKERQEMVKKKHQAVKDLVVKKLGEPLMNDDEKKEFMQSLLNISTEPNERIDAIIEKIKMINDEIDVRARIIISEQQEQE